MGDLKGAKKILREFDIEYETSDSVMGAMVGVGALRAAREYSKDKKNVEEYRKTFESIRSNTAEACGEPINRNYYILAANSYHNKVKKRVFSLESKHSLDNLMDEDRSVTGVVFEPYTRSFFTLGLERLSYDWTVEYCR